MDNRVTILFTSQEDRAKFKNLYRGKGEYFVWSYENYNGSLVEDRYLGCNTKFLLHLEREKVKDFRRLKQDVENFKGTILLQ